MSSFFLVFFVITLSAACVVCRLVRRYLILRLIVVFVWFLLKNRFQSITYSINNLGVNITNSEARVFW